ncbi:Prefoldin subunit-domain-containing protein [Podospora didyma]|uniref:Prefoldin subunit-domain-containing protein n=1 Tax=Podospora didyma TaxID=330526 RepID=A0AAE0U846_9PEZI|nr:Prefoldin subunit-domain-containing protein [Podospora didyma]
MTQPKNHLSDLDRHVQLLEGRVDQLRASLTHWQKWYLEYSAVKEEVEQLPSDPPPRKELARIRRDLDSQLLSKKEINEIFGKNDLKDQEKVVSLLSRRIDYVERNIDTLKKQLETEENKLATAVVVAYPDAGNDEETGLPLTDIIEELDDDDNVINYRLQAGGDVQPRVLETLKKAGIHELPKTEADLPQNQAPPTSVKEDLPVAEPTPVVAATPSHPSKQSRPSPSSGAKKTVSFSDDTKKGHEVAEPPKSAAGARLEEIMQKAKENEAIDLSKAVIPENESADDSELRRQMLEYGMSEIGPVVAELELDDGSTDDDEDWDISDEDEGDEDDEDELGRSKHSIITDDYIKRMQELEKRLGVKSAFTVERPQPKSKENDEGVAGIGRIAVNPPVGDAKPAKPASGGKKSVKFAKELDIAGESIPGPALAVRPKPPTVNPIGDIVEKTTAFEEEDDDDESEDEPEPPKRVSRFKKERAGSAKPSAPVVPTLPLGPHQVPAKFLNETWSEAQHETEPAPPEGQTLADTIIERSSTSEAKGPDDVDDSLLYQAAAVEYNRLRNKLIQKENGFLKPEEPETLPLDEEEGGPKRMSKFKAARLARS